MWLTGLLLLFAGTFTLAQEYHFIVDQNGSGDFLTVQQAIDAVPDLRGNETRILIKKGEYKEKITLPPTKTNVTLIGEDRDGTIVSYDDFAQRKNRFGEEIGTSGSSTFFIFGDGFRAKNLTFENSAGPVGQAVAVRIDGDRIVFENCRFLGNQDTLYPHGKGNRVYFTNCYIEGTTDFIFGWSVAVFENCEIFSKQGGHYITAASTDQNQPYGFVFINCRLTGDAPAGSVYLGRPWRPYARTVFLNCAMNEHIHPEGWHNWNKPDAEKTAFYAEFNSSGPGSNDQRRVAWSHQLAATEALEYTLRNILKDWIPEIP